MVLFCVKNTLQFGLQGAAFCRKLIGGQDCKWQKTDIILH